MNFLHVRVVATTLSGAIKFHVNCLARKTAKYFTLSASSMCGPIIAITDILLAVLSLENRTIYMLLSNEPTNVVQPETPLSVQHLR